MTRERASKHWFVNEIDSELQRVVPPDMTYIVANLIFILISPIREKLDGGRGLVVAERFEAGHCQSHHAERKLQSESQIRVARLGKVQQAGVEHERAEPGRTERISIADDGVPVIVVRDQSGGGQRRLLYQGIVREVAVFRGAQTPLRPRRVRRANTGRPANARTGQGT